MQRLLIRTFLTLNGWYMVARKLFFRLFGKIILIYFLNKSTQNINNITLNYITGWGLGKYKQGDYFCKIYDIDGSSSIGFSGGVRNVAMLRHKGAGSDGVPRPYRKNVTFFNGENMINVDLNAMDAYMKNTSSYPNPIIDLQKILRFMNASVTATHVCITKIMPYKKEMLPIDDMTIYNLYA